MNNIVKKVEGGSRTNQDPLLMLHATLEKMQPHSTAAVVDNDKFGEMPLTRVWTNEDLEEFVKASHPSPKSQASALMGPSSPPCNVMDADADANVHVQFSKEQRSRVLRSLKDLIKADKQNLKLEIQSDGTKRLVMDLSDLDTVMDDFPMSLLEH
jgi:hypothetical protein